MLHFTIPCRSPAEVSPSGSAAPARPTSPQPCEGTVKWFDTKKGFGFILSPEGEDVFVHFTSILGDGFRSLKDGELVRYDLIRGDKGLHATQVDRFTRQTVQVKPSSGSDSGNAPRPVGSDEADQADEADEADEADQADQADEAGAALTIPSADTSLSTPAIAAAPTPGGLPRA